MARTPYPQPTGGGDFGDPVSSGGFGRLPSAFSRGGSVSGQPVQSPRVAVPQTQQTTRITASPTNYSRGTSVTGQPVQSTRVAVPQTPQTTRITSPTAGVDAPNPADPYLGTLQGTPAPTTPAPNPYAPATNYGTHSFGGPVLNPDGSVSAGMPDAFGSFGFNPFANWTGTNSETGQIWNVGDRYLSEQGATKMMELLGLDGVPVMNTPGSIKDWTRLGGTVFGPQSGTVAGPGGVGMWRYSDPATQQLIDLAAYAPYFMTGQDDIGKFLFENRNDTDVKNALRYLIPSQIGNLDDLKTSIASNAAALANPVIPTIPSAGGGNVGGGTAPGGTGGTGNTGGTGGTDTGNRAAIDDFIALMQGLYQGSNPFTLQSFLSGGTLGTPGGNFGQDYLDGLAVLGNFTNLGDQLLGLLTPQDLFDISPTGMYSQFGPAAYLQRQLYPEFYM